MCCVFSFILNRFKRSGRIIANNDSLLQRGSASLHILLAHLCEQRFISFPTPFRILSFPSLAFGDRVAKQRAHTSHGLCVVVIFFEDVIIWEQWVTGPGTRDHITGLCTYAWLLGRSLTAVNYGNAAKPTLRRHILRIVIKYRYVRIRSSHLSSFGGKSIVGRTNSIDGCHLLCKYTIHMYFLSSAVLRRMRVSMGIA